MEGLPAADPQGQVGRLDTATGLEEEIGKEEAGEGRSDLPATESQNLHAGAG